MSQPLCAPPASLTFWATPLLVEACLLGLVVLALATQGLRRWRSQGIGAVSLSGTLGALGALALLIWSLALRSRMATLYTTLAANYTIDPFYCTTGGFHGNYFPARYQLWLQQTTQLVDLVQRAAVATTLAAVALLFVAFALPLWRRRRRPLDQQPAHEPAASVTPVPGAATIAPAARQRTWRMGRGRMWQTLLTLTLITASLGLFAVLRLRQTSAQPAPCSSAITASDLRSLQADNIILTLSSASVPIDRRMALTASQQNLDPGALAKAPCVVAQLTQVRASGIQALTPGRLVWAIAYRTLGPGSHDPATTPAATRRDLWIFIDAQTAQWLAGASVAESTPA
jgi:hypothetical protein